jgi:hypothetical protein
MTATATAREQPMPDVQEAIHESIWQGTFNVLGVDVVCHVLNDGRRIIEAESMAKMFAAMAETGADPTTPDFEQQATGFAKWLMGTATLPVPEAVEVQATVEKAK